MIADERGEQLALCEAVQDAQPTREQNRVLHKTIQEVTDDIEGLEFNTAIARMMEFTNFFTKESVRPTTAMESFVLILSPFAPHIAEELWQLLGHDQSLAYETWPSYEAAHLERETIEIPVQINGKLRGRITVPSEAGKDELEQAASADERVAKLLAGKTIVKAVVVPGRLVNFVVK